MPVAVLKPESVSIVWPFKTSKKSAPRSKKKNIWWVNNLWQNNNFTCNCISFRIYFNINLGLCQDWINEKLLLFQNVNAQCHCLCELLRILYLKFFDLRFNCHCNIYNRITMCWWEISWALISVYNYRYFSILSKLYSVVNSPGIKRTEISSPMFFSDRKRWNVLYIFIK